MLCKWCSGFCQKVYSLLWGFFVLLWVFFVLVFYLLPPPPLFFFLESNTESFTRGI